VQHGQRRQQQGGEEASGGSSPAAGCLVHFVSPIVSTHWNFTARILPAIENHGPVVLVAKAHDSNGDRFPLLAATVFSFQG
jgi:hypothetical protein